MNASTQQPQSASLPVLAFTAGADSATALPSAVLTLPFVAAAGADVARPKDADWRGQEGKRKCWDGHLLLVVASCGC